MMPAVVWTKQLLASVAFGARTKREHLFQVEGVVTFCGDVNLEARSGG